MDATNENLKVIVDTINEMVGTFEQKLCFQEALDAAEALMPAESLKIREITEEAMEAMGERDVSPDSSEILLKALQINEIVLPSFERAISRPRMMELAVNEKITDEHIQLLEDSKLAWLAEFFREAKERAVPQQQSRLTFEDARMIQKAVENTFKNLDVELLREEKDKIDAVASEEENNRLSELFLTEMKRGIFDRSPEYSPWSIMKALAFEEFSFGIIKRAISAERLTDVVVLEGMTEQRVKFLEASKFNNLAGIFKDALALRKDAAVEVFYPELRKEDVDPILEAIERTQDKIDYCCSNNELVAINNSTTVVEDARKEALFDGLLAMRAQDDDFLSKPKAMRDLLEIRDICLAAAERCLGSERLTELTSIDGLSLKHIELLETQGFSTLGKTFRAALEKKEMSPENPDKTARAKKAPGLDND